MRIDRMCLLHNIDKFCGVFEFLHQGYINFDSSFHVLRKAARHWLKIRFHEWERLAKYLFWNRNGNDWKQTEQVYFHFCSCSRCCFGWKCTVNSFISFRWKPTFSLEKQQKTKTQLQQTKTEAIQKKQENVFVSWISNNLQWNKFALHRIQCLYQ